MLEFKEIKKDEIFYECEYGTNMKFIALEDAHRKKGDEEYWEFRGRRVKTGEVIDFGSREGFSNYGLKLYKESQYANTRTLKSEID